MATFTVTNSHSSGNLKVVHGTFTTTTGDSSVSLTNSTHGLNYIVDYHLTINAGGVGVQEPKVSISAGTITATYDDTLGYSGTFYVKGR
jgi:hypothetical protein